MSTQNYRVNHPITKTEFQKLLSSETESFRRDTILSKIYIAIKYGMIDEHDAYGMYLKVYRTQLLYDVMETPHG